MLFNDYEFLVRCNGGKFQQILVIATCKEKAIKYAKCYYKGSVYANDAHNKWTFISCNQGWRNTLKRKGISND